MLRHQNFESQFQGQVKNKNNFRCQFIIEKTPLPCFSDNKNTLHRKKELFFKKSS